MIPRILIVLALLMNAAVPAGAATADAAPEPAGHAGHHGPGEAPAHPMHDDDAGGPPAVCCSQPGCDCGCAAPQVLSFAIESAPAAWNRAPAAYAFRDTPPAVRPAAAPFRPPA